MNPIVHHISPQLSQLFAENNIRLKNATISHLFLDKVGKIIGQEHPDHKAIYSSCYSSSVYSSLFVIKQLERILPRVKRVEIREAVESWIQDEKKYLKYAIKLDSWRATPEMLKLFFRGGVERIEVPKIQVDPTELNELVHELEVDASNLKKNESLKFLGGDGIHETRIIVRRKGVKYQLVYLDTNLNYQIRYNANHLTGSFWKEIVAYKLQPYSFPTSIVFSKVGTGMRLEGSHLKSQQMTRSCSGQAILADLKHHMHEKVDIISYKEIKKMMIEEVLAFEEDLEPAIVKYLKFRLEIFGLSREEKKRKREEFAALNT